MSSKERRREQQQARQRAAHRRKLLTYVLGVAAVVILVGVGFFVFSRPGQAVQTFPLAKCEDVQNLPDEGRVHILPGETPVYQSNPPTSGRHNPEPYSAGIFNTPLDPTKLVHSLEHGYIVIYYRDLNPDELTTLANIVRSDQRKVILDPYANNPTRVVLTAWAHKQQCDGVNEPAIRQFIATFREKAPESSAP